MQEAIRRCRALQHLDYPKPNGQRRAFRQALARWVRLREREGILGALRFRDPRSVSFS